ncbi:hypothetical protein [Streptomyces olivochromogenes]|uniref:hypothetical protein n=1 Tax=Streptomyces olivochromogenes TaxID=1963 RepID=UPI00074B156A|nr:hypothetical protein [Streptomyces olivochromogenes]KUN50182.1 hypothetical protein AQJ27_00045 [Streptomyces olivochromogenes]
MIRSDLESALARDDSSSARAARLALQAGADFELFSEGHQAISARQFWDTWAFRHQTMLETGVTPRPGLAEAVDKLQAAGTSLVHLARITSPQRRFVIFLAEDLTHCIACMG